MKVIGSTVLMKYLGQWLGIALGMLWLHGAVADERIVDFSSDIKIEQDGELLVTETLVVNAEGKQIRRGIFRDFPTLYQDRSGQRVRVPFEILSLTRNGVPEPYHTESLDSGQRIYFGSSDHLLKPGQHRYQFRYRTARQLGYFENHDELYWNVTGNGWAFPIESASATVTLPEPVPASSLSMEGYTGPEGSRSKDYRVSYLAPGVVRITATSVLQPSEGLTLVLSFPKGLVAAPTSAQKRAWFWQDNWGLVACGLALVLAILWFVFAWLRVGRDPAAGSIYPRYQPPSDYSPAGLRYVWRMAYDRTGTVAALISLAVKGVLQLQQKDDDWEVSRLGRSTASITERALIRKMFAAGDRLVFEQENHRRIKSAISAHERALSSAMERRYFRRNRWWLLPGLLLSVAGLLAMAVSLPGEQKAAALFLVVFSVFWNMATYALLVTSWRAWRDLRGVLGRLGALLKTLFALPFAASSLVVMGMFVSLVGWYAGLLLLTAVMMNLLFYHLIRAPTPAGRQLLDEIEGLRLYLSVAERDDLERQHREFFRPGAEGALPMPAQDLDHFESLLPYAVALDCADTWAGRFEARIRAAEQAGQLQDRSWYRPGLIDSDGFSASKFSSSVGSGLASTLSSAATAPGSSSGSGGGGSSGGGGGGGGGGGW